MNISAFTDCADCGACLNICPAGAVSIKGDGLFYTPAVDAGRCMDCGECVRVCPVNNDIPAARMLCAYGAIHSSRETVARSSSGGGMSAIARAVLDDGGVVYGAAFSDDFRSVVFRSTDEVPLDALRRSKYTESIVGDAFEKIRRQLSEGRRVLFCGTPCQVAGLKSFLGAEDDRLLTCDFICGGLPSHKMYREYIEDLEKRFSSTVTNVNFRPKAYGWREHAIKIGFENGKTYLKPAVLDPYFSAIISKQLNVRDYCGKCKFPAYHQSDIIMADFWLYTRLTNKQDDDSGISLLAANSRKGAEVLDKLSEIMSLFSVDIKDLRYILTCHQRKEETAQKRERYLSAYAAAGVVSAGKEYSMDKGIKAVKAHLRGWLKKRPTN